MAAIADEALVQGPLLEAATVGVPLPLHDEEYRARTGAADKYLRQGRNEHFRSYIFLDKMDISYCTLEDHV